MSWWSSLVESVSDAYSWIWDNVPFQRTVTTGLTAGSNVIFESLEQAVAVKKVLNPSPNSLTILDNMKDIVIYDVLPVMGVNYVNMLFQDYVRHSLEEQALTWSPYLAVCMSVIDGVVTLYTFKKSTEMLVHSTLVEFKSPNAFNEKKLAEKPETECIQNCNSQRFAKGYIRELFILFLNQQASSYVRTFPLIGEPAYWILNTLAWGNIIHSIATPELCGRHKFKGRTQERLYTLGLGYLAGELAINTFAARVGLPYIANRTLLRLWLSCNVNLAAQRHLSSTSDEPTFPFDPLQTIENVSFFVFEWSYAGGKKIIPEYIKKKAANSIFNPLPLILKWLIILIESDKEKEHVKESPFFIQSGKKIGVMFWPKMFHGTHEFITDPIISQHWDDFQKGSVDVLKYILKVEDNFALAIARWSPEMTARAIKYFTGIPKPVTKNLLLLTRDEDVLHFVNTLYHWFKRHGLVQKTSLVISEKTITLHDPFKTGVPSPSKISTEELIVVDYTELGKKKRSTEDVTSMDLLFFPKEPNIKPASGITLLNDDYFQIANPDIMKESSEVIQLAQKSGEKNPIDATSPTTEQVPVKEPNLNSTPIEGLSTESSNSPINSSADTGLYHFFAPSNVKPKLPLSQFIQENYFK